MTGRVAANLIVGADGATTLAGSSVGLSFPADRTRFHQLRQEFKVILIGGKTARTESYSKTPLPLIVISHHPLPPEVAQNPSATAWNLDLQRAIPLAVESYGDLLLEGGANLATEAIGRGLLTELFITRSPKEGGENLLDLSALLVDWEEISNESVEGGQFFHYRIAPSHD